MHSVLKSDYFNNQTIYAYILITIHCRVYYHHVKNLSRIFCIAYIASKSISSAPDISPFFILRVANNLATSRVSFSSFSSSISMSFMRSFILYIHLCRANKKLWVFFGYFFNAIITSQYYVII